jgi:hypothetical protein
MGPLPSKLETLLRLSSAPTKPHDGVLRQICTTSSLSSICMSISFLAAFTVRTIIATTPARNIAKPTTPGSGGKPLPATNSTHSFIKKTIRHEDAQTQKRDLNLVSLAAVFTFIGNLVRVIARSLVRQKEYW